MIRTPTYSSAAPGPWHLTMKTSGNHTYLLTIPLDAYKNTCGFITGNVLDGSCLIVNTDLIRGYQGRGLCRSVKSGIKGQDRNGRPGLTPSAFAQLTNILLAMGGYEDDAAWKYVEDLFTNIDGKIIESSSGGIQRESRTASICGSFL